MLIVFISPHQSVNHSFWRTFFQILQQNGGL